MDLADLLTALQRRWAVLLLVVVPIVAGAAWYASSLPSTYEARAVVAFQPRPSAPVGADVIRLVLPRYTAILVAPATADQLAAEVDLDPVDVESALDVAIPPETSTVEITVEDTDADRAATLANRAAAVVLDAADGDDLLVAEQVVQAAAAREPAGPPRRLLIAAAAVVALFAGVGAALAAERVRPAARTTAEVEAALDLPVVGRLPAVRRTRGLGELMGDPAFGDGIRLLRASLGQLGPAGGVRVVAVTPVRPGSGSSAVVCALAASVAAVDSRVLLVDGDLLAPTVADRLGVEPGPGLSAVLEGTASLATAARPSGTTRLDVLAGDADPHGVDRVAMGFPMFRLTALERYDLIVVATPDVRRGSAAPLLTAQADGVLLVVERGATVPELREALRTLELVGATALGAVLVG